MNKVCPHCGSLEIPMVEITSKDTILAKKIQAERDARSLEIAELKERRSNEKNIPDSML
jgi:hypothetical protein